MIVYYQFLSSHNAITNLERKMVKVSRIKKVNDLFELQPYLRFDKRRRKRLGEVRSRIADTYGMVCFSEDWQEPIMWAHYADRNRGIVLGFEFVSNKYYMKPVDYPEERERKRIPFDLTQSIASSDYIDAVGYIKYANWSYEKEHRFFVKLADCLNIEGDYFLKFDNHLVLRKVIVGPAHPYKSKKNYTKMARYLVGLVKSFSAELMVTRPEFGGYRIVRCGMWTPRFEELMWQS